MRAIPSRFPFTRDFRTRRCRELLALVAAGLSIWLAGCAPAPPTRVVSAVPGRLLDGQSGGPAPGKAYAVFRVGYSYENAHAPIRPSDIEYHLKNRTTSERLLISVNENIPLQLSPAAPEDPVAVKHAGGRSRSALVAAELAPGDYEIEAAAMSVSGLYCTTVFTGSHLGMPNAIFVNRYEPPMRFTLQPGSIVYLGFLDTYVHNANPPIPRCPGSSSIPIEISLIDTWATDSRVLRAYYPGLGQAQVTVSLPSAPVLGVRQ